MHSISTYLSVMAGGALGSAGRLWLGSLVTARFGDAFPIGTLAVNTLGCLAIGLFTGLSEPSGIVPAPLLLRQFVSIGILGGFTTFSTFSIQTLHLATHGAWASAALNVITSVALCLVCVWLGMLLAGALNPR